MIKTMCGNDVEGGLMFITHLTIQHIPVYWVENTSLGPKKGGGGSNAYFRYKRHKTAVEVIGQKTLFFGQKWGSNSIFSGLTSQNCNQNIHMNILYTKSHTLHIFHKTW